jgi:hypothetical protein
MNLPEEVVAQYIEQEHFSLRRLVCKLDGSQSTKNIQLSVVYTRTDMSIHRLPGDTSTRRSEAERTEAIYNFIHEDVQSVSVEHLYLLQSEAMLRSSITSWI